MIWKRVVLGVVVLAGAGLAFWWYGPLGGSSRVLRLPGVVEIQEVRLGSKVGGRVESVNVVEGTVAEAGRVLVTFEAPELKAQRQQAQARLDAARADLAKAEYGPRAEEIDAAKRAMEAARARWKLMEAGFRPEEKREAQSMWEMAESELKLRTEEFDRAKRLYQQNASAKAEYESARANIDRARSDTARAKAHLEMLLAGNRKEEIQNARALHEQAQANYDLLLAGTREEDIAAARAKVEEARGRVRELDAMIEETVVRAPERVVVDVLAVRKGDLVPPNQPILRVLRADDLWVKVYVAETDLWRLHLNGLAEVTVDGYPQTLEGTVMQIGSESEFTPRNVQSPDERRHQVFAVKVRVANPGSLLKSGMAATVTVR